MTPDEAVAAQAAIEARYHHLPRNAAIAFAFVMIVTHLYSPIYSLGTFAVESYAVWFAAGLVQAWLIARSRRRLAPYFPKREPARFTETPDIIDYEYEAHGRRT